MQWLMLGVAVVSVDVRGQCGATGDRQAYSSGSVQSVITHGLLNKYEYYFRYAYMDCVRALDFACAQKEVDAARLIVEGGSQGGALTMAVAALDSRPYLALADVPSNSNLEERVKNENGSFSAVTEYLRAFPHHTERAFETLSYFDTMNLADRIRCRMLACVGLKDNVCPAKLYFATYNRITSPKEIRLYPFNGHEGGGATHNEVKLRFVGQYI
jgi:cephalosporin-C deacetylase